MSNLSKFGFAYEGLAKAKANGALESLINGGAAWMFIQNVAMDLNNLQKDSAWKIYLTDLVQQLSAAAAQHFGNDQQYEWFLAVIGVIEAKLRKESGAAISEKERKQDFLQYLPMASDTNRLRNYKVERLDDFLKRWAKEGWLTKKDYISIFDLNNWKRSID